MVWACGSLLLCRKQMGRLRRSFGQFIHSLFNLDVGAGEPAMMLPQMLLPGWHGVLLHEPVGERAVAVQLPANGTGAKPRQAKIAHGREKSLLTFGGYGVRSCYQHGPALLVRLD